MSGVCDGVWLSGSLMKRHKLYIHTESEATQIFFFVFDVKAIHTSLCMLSQCSTMSLYRPLILPGQLLMVLFNRIRL